MGIWQWLFGSGTKPESKPVEEPPQQTPPAAPSVPALSPAERAAQIQRNSTSAFIPVTGAAVGGAPTTSEESVVCSVGGITITASLQVREMTPEEIAEMHGWFAKAFDWVMMDVTISGADRQKLFDFLRENWNNSRLNKGEIEALGITLSWPRAEAYVRDKQQEIHEAQVVAFDAMGAEEALRCLKAHELKVLTQAHDVAVKGRATKAIMIAALCGLEADTLRLIRDGIVERLKRELPDPAVVVQRELVELLHLRIFRARYRLLRAEQIIESVNTRWIDGKPLYTHIRVNLFGHGDEVAACGLKQGDIRPSAELMELVKQPSCTSLDCRCQFSPHSPERSSWRGR